MKILLIHNEYQQPGGEDQVFAAEANLLEDHGHEILRYSVHNDQIARMNPVSLAETTVWSRSSYRELKALVRREQPDIAHFHNTFPLISPAGYYAAKAGNVPVVQTLHNYRLICPNALFFRDGHVCEDCLGKTPPWPGVLHACYRGSRQASGAVAAMLTAHRLLRTWTRMVDVYIALNEFARGKFVQGGLPAEKIIVKPNTYPDPGQHETVRNNALFVGRLSVEKGIDVLLEAWELLGDRMKLTIVGEGPMADVVAERTRRLENVEWLGRRPKEEVLELMKRAGMLVFPSVWYEGFPMTMVEAYGVGLPIVASNLGSLATLVEPGRTGLLFRPNDPGDLAAKVRWAVDHPNELDNMRRGARKEFEAKYTAEQNYGRLLGVYRVASERAGS